MSQDLFSKNEFILTKAKGDYAHDVIHQGN